MERDIFIGGFKGGYLCMNVWELLAILEDSKSREFFVGAFA